MSTKKVTPKTQEPKAKYNIGQHVFTISYHKSKPEELVEVEIVERIKREYPEKDFIGKKIGTRISYEYFVKSPVVIPFIPNNLKEYELYPSFFEAAKVFAKSFLVTLK
jgi:hypothetical protein